MRELLWTLELDVDTFRWLYQAEPVTIARYGTQGVMLFDHLTHDFAALFPREGVERLYSLDEVSYPLDVVTDECLADADLTSCCAFLRVRKAGRASFSTATLASTPSLKILPPCLAISLVVFVYWSDCRTPEQSLM